MQNIELDFDKTRHVMFSKECEKEIKNKISLNYQSDLHDKIWKDVQLKYTEFLSKWNVDLGGKKNFHNGKGGTYDCIALMSYYVVCKDKTNLQELEKMEGNLFLNSFKKMKFVNCNKLFFKKLMYKAFVFTKKKCDKWHDYQMNVGKFDKNKPIYYEFTSCPVAEFAKQFNLLEIMPAFCNPDYKAMEAIHAKLIRTTTCSNGNKCDYTICGDQDEFIKNHPEYVDECGYRRNK